MRKVAAVLGVLLLSSVIANVYLWHRAETEQTTATLYKLIVENIGRAEGEAQAGTDFAAGKLLWYQFGDTQGVPRDKSDRRAVGWKVEEVGMAPHHQHQRFRAFAESYNRKIDELVAKRVGSPAKKG